MSRSAPQTPSLPSALRSYLYITAAVTGGAIMIVEILGAKMLAPYFGSSHFVWTAQIAVTMVALAAGYYAGGRLVDRTPDPAVVYKAIIFAACYLCLSGLLVEKIAYWALQFNLATGSFICAVVLFFLPLCLLAMVGPIFVRVLTDSVAFVGSNVGRLTAISTVGSFGGTILIGYVLIPLLPNAVSMYLTAAVLLLVGVGYFVIVRRRITTALMVMMAAGMALGFAGVRHRPAYAQAIEIDHANSHFGVLQVLDDPKTHRRYLLNDYLMQDSYDPSTRQSLSAFTEILYLLGRGYTPHIDHVLCIGMGVGIMPMQFARDGAEVDAVEINPAVVPLATRHFDLDTNRVRVVVGDGRYYLNECTKKYDTVILDAFVGDSMPTHLFTRETFQQIRDILRPGGTLVINSLGNLSAGKTFCTASIEKTLRDVFPSVRVHVNPNEKGVTNVFFVAGNTPDRKLDEARCRSRTHPDVRDQIIATLSCTAETNPFEGQILTDQHNPVEFYDATNREEMRRRMALLVPRL
jgi:spermidine synthase